MTIPHSKSRSFELFNAIAGRYDFINSVLSFGMHNGWRHKMCQKLPQLGQIEGLDLATGTGDVAIEMVNDPRVVSVTGLDMSEGMIAHGVEKLKDKGLTDKIELVHGDAQEIPFEDASFDSVTMSFGIRNVPDASKCLRDAFRVLKPGGRMIVMEFALPKNKLFRGLHLFYLRNMLPVVGKVLSGHDVAYRYLNETIEEFPYGDDFVNLMTKAGFKNAGFDALSFGIVNLYWGDKV